MRNLIIHFLQNDIEDVIKNPTLNLINYNDKANIADVKQNSWETKTNDRTIGEMIVNSLHTKYHKINNKENNYANSLLLALLIDIQKESKWFKLRILDNLSWKQQSGREKFRYYYENFKGNGAFLKNFVLTVNFKDEFIQSKKWNHNSCNLFFSLYLTSDSHEKYQFKYKLNKITFINDYINIDTSDFQIDKVDFLKDSSDNVMQTKIIQILEEYYSKEINNISFRREDKNGSSNFDLDFDLLSSLINLFLDDTNSKIENLITFYSIYQIMI